MSLALQPDPADTSDAQLAHWLERRQQPEWSAHDEQAFNAWLTADPLHHQAYQQWQAHAALGADTQATHEQLRLKPSPLKPSSTPRTRRRFVHLSLGVAGITGAALATALGWPLWQAHPLYQQQLQTQRGEQRSVELPDGSLLDLDTDTSLMVRYYRSRREIALLQGQAVFHVTSTPERPFHVTTADARITVTGTRFSVRSTPSLPDRAATEILVQEGSVRVVPSPQSPAPSWHATSANTVVALHAGQALTIGQTMRSPAVSQPLKPPFASWRSQHLHFSATPLSQVIAEIERYTDTGVIGIAPGAAQLRVSGTFNPYDGDSTRRMLQDTLPIHLQAQDQGWWIQMR